MPKQHDERAFEDAIEHSLVENGGYRRGDPNDFDAERGIFPAAVLEFIKKTQPDKWTYLENSRQSEAEQTLLDDLCRALDSNSEGCLSVLRHGFKCFGKTFRVAYPKPPSRLNPDTQQSYHANDLAVIRQLRYSSRHGNTLDMTLALGGIPIVTLELKNPLTGQTWRDAVKQYKTDRDPKDLVFRFKKRTLVHFAVDPDEVQMTTRLDGDKTRFLPFNKGDGDGAGNPGNPRGHKTAYLWEEVLAKDSLLDVIAWFVHLQKGKKAPGQRKAAGETMIFPRYHQLDSVRQLERHARKHGVGRNYLVQHSAGSGKSNSIAWLAHRLARLHNSADEKTFASVVVITDRVVLDQQLQNTIYQMEHKQGVVEKIDQDSAQLAEALTAGRAIIITTLQKFPHAYEKMGALAKRNYAVIIDEAHSSQGGETARAMKNTLAGPDAEPEDYQQQIINVMKSRQGKQPNISFFAFTATPRHETLEVFGQPGADGKPQPFHLYGMRQAIEEGFILDVLGNYTAYKVYYKLIKSAQEDPDVEKRRAARALARFVSLHPHNIAEKTETMVEHFRRFTMNKIGGRAKAMVVTASRLHAVRYKLAFDRCLAERGYADIKTLVAFSGLVTDPDAPGEEYAEEKMNIDGAGRPIREKELPARFAENDDYRLLIVAEKYQLGFDQPLLHTMYVDKKLRGIQAVQTLSRLNRTAAGKEDTFVLDFVNGADDIRKDFQPFYEQAVVSERIEAGKLYNLQAELDAHQIYHEAEVEEFCRVFYDPKQDRQSTESHGRLYALLDPAVARFGELGEEEQDDFRNQLVNYRLLYGFLSQVIPFTDPDLEKRYAYIRFLLSVLPRGAAGPRYDFENDVTLEHYRQEEISKGKIALEAGNREPVAPPGTAGGVRDNAEIKLSKLIDLLNERFGAQFTEDDQLFVDSVCADAVADDDLRQTAEVNSPDNFGIVFRDRLKQIFINRLEENEQLAARFLNDKEFQAFINDHLKKLVYQQFNPGAAAGRP